MVTATQDFVDYQRMLDRIREQRDYSQSKEQAAIVDALAAMDPFGAWRFLDIGAGDGQTFSNTRALALAGWGGVLVEPAAWAFERLASLYRDDRSIEVIQAVVTGTDRGLVQFYYTAGDHLSTVDEAEKKKWRQVNYRGVVAAACSLADVLVWAGPTPVVSIDAEGLTTELVEWFQRLDAYWDAVDVIVFERDPKRSARELITVGAWEIIAETPNNYVLRRLS